MVIINAASGSRNDVKIVKEPIKQHNMMMNASMKLADMAMPAQPEISPLTSTGRDNEQSDESDEDSGPFAQTQTGQWMIYSHD